MTIHCLITGTTHGIGRHLAKLALSRGALVVSIGRTGLAAHGRLHEGDIDVTDDLALGSFIGALPIPRLDVVVNNAGVFLDPDVGLRDLDTKHLVRTFDVNAAGPVRVVKHALGLLERSERPTIVNLASDMALHSPRFGPGSYAYRMSKAALNMAMFCLAREFPRITTFSVHPGHVRTAMGGSAATVDPAACAQALWRLALDPPPSGSFVDALGRRLDP